MVFVARTLRVGGKLARACLMLAVQVDGLDIETVKALRQTATACRLYRLRSGAITRCNAGIARQVF